MSVPAQSAIFSLAVQPGMVGDGNLNVNSLEWYRTRAPRINMGVQEMADVFPLETGGPIVPTGAFKSGVSAAGDVELIPRLKQFIGLVLYGALGAVDTQTNSVWNAATDAWVANTGVTGHRFTFHPNSFVLPWMATRVVTPGATANETFGQVFADTMIEALRLSIPAAGLLGLTVSMRARKPSFPLPAEVNAWDYVNTTEDSTTAPVSGEGSFLIGGEKPPITNATIEFANNLDQQMIVGSYFPDTFTALNRQVSVSITYKWKDPILYRKILTGTASDEDWATIPFIQSTNGATKAFETTFYAPSNIPGSSPAQRYMIKIIANRVFWQIDRGGIQLQAGNIIEVPYRGTVLEPEAGKEYIEIIVHNDTSFTIPVLPGAGNPTLNLANAVNYTGTSDVVLDAAATVTDADSLDFNGGQFAVVLGGSGYDPDFDLISLGAGASVSGTNLLVGAVVVGTLVSIPAVGESLVAMLNADATPALIQTLVQNIQYGTGDDASRIGDVVTATVSLSDGDGGFAVSEVVTITHA